MAESLEMVCDAIRAQFGQVVAMAVCFERKMLLMANMRATSHYISL